MGQCDIGRQGGVLFYTCFHTHAQTSEAERKLLSTLVLKQVSSVSGIPIEILEKQIGT